ncbi:MAG: tetratricopeptide repeat protein [Bacteroidales bacterium]|nr:tetratricopeptide repeat protein [Bacteroidales bacterium]
MEAKKLIFVSNDSSLLLYNKALKLAEKFNDEEEIALALRDIGQFYIVTGSFDIAIDTLKKAWEIAGKKNLTKLIGEIKSNIGVAYDYKGKYEIAIDYYSKAIDDFLIVRDTISLATVYLNIGIVYEEMSKADEAIEYYNIALEFSRNADDKTYTPVILNNIGVVYMDLKEDYSKAQNYFEQALAIFSELQEKRGISNIYNNIGEIHESKTNFDMAIESYEKALAINEENDEKQGIANSLRNLGNVYGKIHDYNKALSYLLRGVEISKNIGFNKNLLEVYGVISEVYDKQAMYKEALKYNRLYISLKDSMMNESMQEKLLDFQTKYETEKKNSEIAQLKLDKLEQLSRLKHQRLINYSLLLGFILILSLVVILLHYYNLKKKANSEKEILIREIHHRVKNNLQTISSLLSLQNNYIADHVIRDIVKESQSRVKSMALIHQLLYKQEIGSKIDFEKYMHQLCQEIASGFGKITDNIECSVHCEKIQLDIDTAIPIGLIANELFINAYKHAFRDIKRKGEITVQIVQYPGNKYVFTFQDNGIGLPDNIIIENSDTLGLKLVHILVKQIKGVLNCRVENGTEFIIVFHDLQRKTEQKITNSVSG